MLKKMRKRLRQRRLALAAALAMALAAPAAPAWADIGAQTFNDGQPHTVSDNITADDIGLFVNLPGSSAIMTGKKITISNVTPTASGVVAAHGGKVTLTDVRINSAASFGIMGDGGGMLLMPRTTIVMTGGSIMATGAGGGVYAHIAVNMTLTNVSIETTNDDSPGVIADSGSIITMNGGSIKTSGGIVSGTGNHGAEAGAAGEIHLTNTGIEVRGDGAFGLSAINSGSIITMKGGSITTAGADGYGVYAGDSAAVTMTGGTITTQNARSYGAFAGANSITGGSDGGTIGLRNVAVRTEGNDSVGVYANNSGAVTMIGGTITTLGARSHGAYAETDATAGSITLTNVAVNANGAGSYALVAKDAGSRITASVDGQNMSGAGGLIVVLGGGRVDLTAGGGSQLYGLTSAGGGTVNLSLSGGATWWMPGAGASSSLTNLVLNGGTVRLAPTMGGPNRLDILTDLNPIPGSSGGTIYMNADFVSPMGGDLIVVGGTANGNHQLFVRALVRPTDPRRVARLVDLNPASPNTATFSGGSDVGIYRYGVAKGVALAGYSGILGPEDIYLYNTFGPSTPVRAAVASSADSIGVWYGEMSEIKKRMGELRMGTQSSDDFWVRAYAGSFNIRPSATSAYNQTMHGLEIGKDNPQAFAGGKKYTGFVAGGGRADNSFSAGGSGAASSTYLGTYASWLKDDGAYIDVIGKYNWFRHSFDTPLMGGGSDSGAYRNTGLGLSAELGKRFTRENGNFIEPAVEVAALWAGKANYTTANGLAVEVPDSRSLQLRAGCTVGRKWQGQDGTSREVYGKVAWVKEYAGDSTVKVDTVGFESSLKGHQWVSGLGFVADAGSYQAYLDVEKSWGNTTCKTWGVNAGYRWKF